MDMARRVEAEWLDELPPADPRAVRSRRDLGRLNTLMAHARIVRGELRRESPAVLRRVAEIGAGDGEFSLRVASGLGTGYHGEWTLLDRQDVEAEGKREPFARRGWALHCARADVLDWLRAESTGSFDAIVANLFLHHFEPGRLAELLSLAAARTRRFIACEPRRSRATLVGSRLLGVIGCNDVTRHDAVVSVHAGFRGRELSASWPAGAWALEERARGLFSHCFVARRT